MEAGALLYPTHVYNLSRFPNYSIANHFGCDTFWQNGNQDADYYIGEKPQLNLGGRSIFWSGLIPKIQNWELDFFPPRVRQDLRSGLLNQAGSIMNESSSMGTMAANVVEMLRQSSLVNDFSIQETPRALHQPYLTPKGKLRDRYFVESTGVFNTAELLINQVGLTPGLYHGDYSGLFLLPNHYVEDVQNHGSHLELVTRHTLNGGLRTFRAVTVVLAGGSIESAKLLARSSMYPWLPDHAKNLVGRGLTDHPTSDTISTYATNIGKVRIPRNSHAKIILCSRGLRSGSEIRYPFNVEMNINHEYWHLRENDLSSWNGDHFFDEDVSGSARIDLKFSFGNPLDEENQIKSAPPYGYVPEIVFHNQKRTSYLTSSRFPALAGWYKNNNEVFDIMNDITYRIFSQFENDGREARPERENSEEKWYGPHSKGFGYGTVHHAVGSLRMPFKSRHDGIFNYNTVVDEDLRVAGTQNLYVCDMSVVPFSSAANPVRTLAALALRLSKHFS